MYPNPINRPSQPNAPAGPIYPGGPAPGSYPQTQYSNGAPTAPPPMAMPAWQPQNQFDDTPELPQPQAPMPIAPPQSTSSGKKTTWVLAICGIALMAALGFYVYAWFRDRDTSPKQPTTSQTAGMQGNSTGQSSSPHTTPAAPTSTSLTEVQNVALVPPLDLSRYTANPANTNSAMVYATKDDACMLQLGVATATSLPGKDAAEVVSQQIQSLRPKNAAVEGPSQGTPLLLRSTSDHSKVYSLPTSNFTITAAGKATVYYYSVAVLKDGKRAFVVRSCEANERGTADKALAVLDQDAAKALVRLTAK